jgi:hypothetical protein
MGAARAPIYRRPHSQLGYEEERKMLTLADRLGRVLLLAVLCLVGFGASASAQQDEVRTFVGNIAGLENIDARFGGAIAPNGNAVAFLGSRDGNWNRQNSKWYVGRVSGNTLSARAQDGTTLTLSLQGNQITGTLGGGQWIGYLTRTGEAGLYRAQVGNEQHFVIVGDDGSWVGLAFTLDTNQYLRTWNSNTGAVQRVSNTLMMAREDADSSMVEMQPVQNYFSEVRPWSGTTWN